MSLRKYIAVQYIQEKHNLYLKCWTEDVNLRSQTSPVKLFHDKSKTSSLLKLPHSGGSVPAPAPTYMRLSNEAPRSRVQGPYHARTLACAGDGTARKGRRSQECVKVLLNILQDKEHRHAQKETACSEKQQQTLMCQEGGLTCQIAPAQDDRIERGAFASFRRERACRQSKSFIHNTTHYTSGPKEYSNEAQNSEEFTAQAQNSEAFTAVHLRRLSSIHHFSLFCLQFPLQNG